MGRLGDRSCKVTSTSKTVKVKAGTYKNAVVVQCTGYIEEPDFVVYNTSYFVKGIGRIKETYTEVQDKKTYTIYELVKL